MLSKPEVKILKAHLALNVKNAEQSIEFYKKMLAIEPAKVRAGYAKFDVQNPPLNLTLNEHSFNERGALSHLGIQVASTADVLTTKARWEKAGLTTFDEIQINCCYAIQNKTWVRDPDGNEWEVFVVLEDNLAETSMCCAANENDFQAEAANLTDKSAVSCCASEPTQISINRVTENSCC